MEGLSVPTYNVENYVRTTQTCNATTTGFVYFSEIHAGASGKAVFELLHRSLMLAQGFCCAGRYLDALYYQGPTRLQMRQR